MAMSNEARTLADLAVELAQKSSGFRHSIPHSDSGLARRPRSRDELLVPQSHRGHDRHPTDTERGLGPTDCGTRDLRLEAKYCRIEVRFPAPDAERAVEAFDASRPFSENDA